MKPFEFHSVGRIVFGCGQASRIGEVAGQLGRSVLLIANPSARPAIDFAGSQLSEAGMVAATLLHSGEPTVDDVQRAVERGRQCGCDLVIGLGGGSAIDLAKATAGLLTNGGEPLDYLEVAGRGRKIARPAMPWIAVPTTAGAGAEATRNAVIAYPPARVKASIRSEHLLARVVIVDPELGVSVPPEVTARSGMDALCQLIESYTSTGANQVTDALAIEGIRLAGRALPRAWADGSDLAAREDMALAALYGGITLTNAGLGAVHGLAAPLGGNCPVPHGAACAVLLPHVMAENIAAIREQNAELPRRRYAEVGRALTGRHLDDAAAIEAALESVRQLVAQLRIPPLASFGLAEQQIPQIAALARRSNSMRYNPVELSEQRLADVLRKAI